MQSTYLLPTRLETLITAGNPFNWDRMSANEFSSKYGFQLKLNFNGCILPWMLILNSYLLRYKLCLTSIHPIRLSNWRRWQDADIVRRPAQWGVDIFRRRNCFLYQIRSWSVSRPVWPACPAVFRSQYKSTIELDMKQPNLAKCALVDWWLT